MDWIIPTLQWYVILLVLGLAFTPITRFIFKRFEFDFGYGFAKAIGILVVSYCAFLFSTLKILPYSIWSLYLYVGIFALIGVSVYKRYPLQTKHNFIPDRMRQAMVIVTEMLFFLSLFFWAYVRGQEPSIRGLEKFMDFGFINSVLRSTYFPPLDMWLSGTASHPKGMAINYYYFGHLTGATLIKITGVIPAIGYNLILASIFALGITQSFSLIGNVISYAFSKRKQVITSGKMIITALFAFFGSYLLNLGGNLHTIYVFTNGYPNEKPIPFWTILSHFQPEKYWYPNATRFIPYTIHEFPSYSYVVADLHGHVFDIIFVLLTLALVTLFFITTFEKRYFSTVPSHSIFNLHNIPKHIKRYFQTPQYILFSIAFGFLCAVHYMTNAFDIGVYVLLISLTLLILFNISVELFLSLGIMLVSIVIFMVPFSAHFIPFVSGIGVNCSPQFLVEMKKLGPFLFERGNCQSSPLWMLGVLWGYFWFNFIILGILVYTESRSKKNIERSNILDLLMIIFFFLGTTLIIIPEFFYMKDIYPAHFRANTMFKLGYQAFIMMMVASVYTAWKLKYSSLRTIAKRTLQVIYIFLTFLIIIYPYFSIVSYYGRLEKPAQLNGLLWLHDAYPQDAEIVEYINTNIKDHPVILEAQGDSYTDFQRISANTGTPTIAGWWVHEWLWRGSANVVGDRIPDIVNIYENNDLKKTQELLRKYNVKYVVVSTMERDKYKNINEEKFNKIGRIIFRSKNGLGALYQLNP